MEAGAEAFGDAGDGGAEGFIAGEEEVFLEAFDLYQWGEGEAVGLEVVAAVGEGHGGGALPELELAGADPPGVVDEGAVVAVSSPGAAGIPVQVGVRPEIRLVLLEDRAQL